ncbi:MAG: hypothetical protein JNK54_01880 [Elusimicrobia bacterium]|jgi:UDP:flavonoid glycosyltransferase YjiC (YdhE family)|nr:hypothetical protein [Elusimicrobiota bacterium]
METTNRTRKQKMSNQNVIDGSPHGLNLTPGRRDTQGNKILFIAEAVTLAHVGRMITLANGIDQPRFTPILAWDDRFNGIVGDLPGPYFPLSSIPTSLFLERLYKGQPTYNFETLDRYVREDLELIHTTSPTAIVGDTRLSLAVSAALAGIPYINVVNAHWSPFAQTKWVVPQCSFVDTVGPLLGQWGFDLLRPLLFRSYAKGFDSLLKKWGRPSLGADIRNIYCAGDRTLYPDLPDLIPTTGLPPSHRFMGPVAWSPDVPVSDILNRPAPGKKTVYVAMGTSGNTRALPAILEGLAGRPLRVLVAAGLQLSVRNPDPTRLELHTSPYFSGQAACQAADLVINNGGSAGINQCLLAGVPFLGVASNLDQFSSMYFSERAGVGKTIRADRVNPGAIARQAGELLDDPSWGRKAKAISAIAHSYTPSDILMEELKSLGSVQA